MAEISVKDIAIAKDTAIKLYRGNTMEFSKESASESIKNLILEAGGCKDKWDMYAFMGNKYKVFSVMKEVITPVVAEAIIDRFESWVDIAQIGLGDIMEFEIMNMDLFEVGYVADGTSDIRRQKLINGKLPMTSFQLGAAVYCEWDEFRRGRIDFSEWITRLAKSFEVKIGQIIIKQISLAYDGLGTKFKKSGSYTDDDLLELITNVEAKSGQSATIYGTKVALANLRKSSQAAFSEVDKVELREMGHVGRFNGCDVIEIPQSMDRKDNHMIPTNMLYIIPNGVKIVKLLFEGDIDVFDVTSEQDRKDLQFEYEFVRRMQIGVCKSSVYGMYKIN